MNYSKIYEKLIEVNREKKDCFQEKHHIIPRCMGGSDDDDNFAYLTPREHIFAHALLVKIHPKNISLQFALIYMSNMKKYSKEYTWVHERRYKRDKQILDKMRKMILPSPVNISPIMGRNKHQSFKGL